jgi:hypothetical protein
MSHCYFPIAFLTQAPAPFRMSLISMAFVADGICGMHSLDATRPASVAVLCGTGAASWRLDAARNYRAGGGGRGEKAGNVKACCG